MINVKADPHPTGTYPLLLEAATGGGKRKRVEIAKHRMVEIQEVTKADENTYFGLMWDYTVIDRAGSVADLKNRKIFTRSEVAAMLSEEWDDRGINHKWFPFAFDVKRHYFIYEKRQMSPRIMVEVLRKLFNSIRAEASVDNVTAAVVQDTSAVERILDLRLTKLEIRVSRPNPDDLAGLAERLRKEMERQDAVAIVKTLEAENDKHPLKPDVDTLMLAALGAEDGYVVGHGYDPTLKGTVTRTTANSPMTVPVTFNPKNETTVSFFSRISSVVSDEVKRRLKALRDKLNQRPE